MAEQGECRSCGAFIKWAVTEKGKRIPLDPIPRDIGNIVLVRAADGRKVARIEQPHTGRPAYVSHFATCPEAERHRKKRRAKQ